MKYLALTIPGNGGDINITAPAQGIQSGGPITLDKIIGVGLELAVFVAVIVCLFMLIWAGFDWLLSEGDKQKVAKARQRLVFSIIGLVVIFMSFMIINIIYTFFFQQSFNFLATQGN
jgi:uncharacterized membrane protein